MSPMHAPAGQPDKRVTAPAAVASHVDDLPNEDSWFFSLTFYLGPDLLFLAVFLTLLSALIIVNGRQVSLKHATILMPLIGMLLLTGVAFVRHARAILRGNGAERRAFVRQALATVRDWFPLVLIIFVYENYHDLTDLIRPDIVDGTLWRLDEALFSVEPTIFLQRITTPWLTELMTMAYMPLFIYPTIVLAILYSRGEFIRFREFGLALSLCFYLGLIGYMLVPAIGPRYAFPEAYSVALTGYLITDAAAEAWRAVESIQRDCFPSLHTALSAITLVYVFRYRRTWRYGRVLFWSWLPPIVALWCSTIYLRYHYAVDVLAGWVLTVICCWAAPVFTRWYYSRKLGRVLATSLDA
jgi:membrane-associated phospholipid phosphatase